MRAQSLDVSGAKLIDKVLMNNFWYVIKIFGEVVCILRQAYLPILCTNQHSELFTIFNNVTFVAYLM